MTAKRSLKEFSKSSISEPLPLPSSALVAWSDSIIISDRATSQRFIPDGTFIHQIDLITKEFKRRMRK